MSLTVRQLPRSEWSRLDATSLGVQSADLPEGSTVIAVERDGELVACWSGFGLVHYHLEGLGVVPAERGNPSVFRKLLIGMRRHVESLGVPSVWTGARTPEVVGMLATAGAEPIDVALYVLPVKETT
jgi:hypothetical protein